MSIFTPFPLISKKKEKNLKTYKLQRARDNFIMQQNKFFTTITVTFYKRRSQNMKDFRVTNIMNNRVSNDTIQSQPKHIFKLINYVLQN